MSLAVQDRLIVALDVPDAAAAEHLVDRLGAQATFYKIGLELIYGGDGLRLAERLIGAGKKVFLDGKLHDIPHTVAAATARICRLGATFLTVHAYPQTMRAAQEAAAGSGLRLLAVSVLTSADDDDLQEAGYGLGAAALVRHRAQQAHESGLHGLVLSPHEVAETRARFGSALALVTPGVRPAGSATGDQKRVMTPEEAIRAGADHLVIGRPITAAPDPAAAHAALLAAIAAVVPPP